MSAIAGFTMPPPDLERSVACIPDINPPSEDTLHPITPPPSPPAMPMGPPKPRATRRKKKEDTVVAVLAEMAPKRPPPKGTERWRAHVAQFRRDNAQLCAGKSCAEISKLASSSFQRKPKCPTCGK